MDVLNEIKENIIAGQADMVRELVKKALNEGMNVEDVLNEGLILAMTVVGERFERKEIYVPEVLFSARAMRAGLEILEPLLISAGIEPKGKAITGTVKGDIHDIGKNLVGTMLKGAGFAIIDLGVDVPPQRFVEGTQAEGAKLICISSLITTSMPYMKTTIEALESAGLKGQVKTMVGGAVVTPKYADEIGADGYAPNAAAAVARAKQLLGLD